MSLLSVPLRVMLVGSRCLAGLRLRLGGGCVLSASLAWDGLHCLARPPALLVSGVCEFSQALGPLSCASASALPFLPLLQTSVSFSSVPWAGQVLRDPLLFLLQHSSCCTACSCVALVLPLPHGIPSLGWACLTCSASRLELRGMLMAFLPFMSWLVWLRPAQQPAGRPLVGGAKQACPSPRSGSFWAQPPPQQNHRAWRGHPVGRPTGQGGCFLTDQSLSLGFVGRSLVLETVGLVRRKPRQALQVCPGEMWRFALTLSPCPWPHLSSTVGPHVTVLVPLEMTSR